MFAACSLAIILLSGCGDDTRRFVGYRSGAARYDDSRFRSNAWSQKFARLATEDWIAIDEANGQPFYGTLLRFDSTVWPMRVYMIVPDGTSIPVGRHRGYVIDLQENYDGSYSELEWLISQPAVCSASDFGLSGDGIYSTDIGEVLRVDMRRRCGGWNAPKLGFGASHIDIDEQFSFQRMSTVQNRLKKTS